MSPQTLQESQVQLEALPPANSGELSELFIRYCAFCCKKCFSTDNNRELLERLSGEDGVFCSFCLRHGFNTKSKKDVLILSFRSIIGWLYHFKYLSGLSGRMWLSEMEDYLTLHQKIGLSNPAFAYDSESLLWFVNFSRIGDGKKQQGIEQIYKTVLDILSCFNLSSNIPELDTGALFNKYRKSIEEFYHKRQRPKNRYMLIPTFSGCGINVSYENRISSSKLRNFDVSMIKARK